MAVRVQQRHTQEAMEVAEVVALAVSGHLLPVEVAQEGFLLSRGQPKEIL